MRTPAVPSLRDQASHGAIDVEYLDGPGDGFFKLGVAGLVQVRAHAGDDVGNRLLAVDLGYLFRVPEWGFALGASVLNLGTDVTFIEAGDPMPITIRGGTSWTVPIRFRDASVTGAVDVEHFKNEKETRWQRGFE